MARRILTTGKAFKRTDGRWGGAVWYMDDFEERKRKCFSGKTKAEVKRKMVEYINTFKREVEEKQAAHMRLDESMKTWLTIFKYPSIERTTYDRYECTAEHQIYPTLGKKAVGSITAADVKKLLNKMMEDGYAYTTSKKVYMLLNEYFHYLTQEEMIQKNPLDNVDMIKRQNYLAMQGKENIADRDKITIFTEEEIEKFKREAFKTWGEENTAKHQQSAAYLLMLNTGLRAGEMLGVLNSDIDLENKTMAIQRSVKEVYSREGTTFTSGREIMVGKTKSLTSNRVVPLNSVALEMIAKLRAERYKGEDSPLVCDEKGGFTRPVNFRKRFYRILEQAGIEQKGLHSLRHTFATKLVNGVKQEDGTIKSLSPREVADLLGHSTSDITEHYYVKRDNERLVGITDGFEF